MAQPFDIPEEKFSTPIEILNLDNRSIHVLRRVGVQTVSQIILTGKANILSLKNVGSVMVERIFWAVAQYLQVPVEALGNLEIIELAQNGHLTKPSNPLSNSIRVLDLPFKIIAILESDGIVQIDQLVSIKFNELKNRNQFTPRRQSQIYRAVKIYLENLRIYDQNNPWDENAQISDTDDKNRKEERSLLPNYIAYTSLKLVLLSIGLNERAKLVIVLRSLRLLTLEEISTEIGGITRERVRQIINQAIYKIQNKLSLLFLYCDYFETRAKITKKGKLKNEDLTIPDLVKEFKSQISGTDLVATEEDLEFLIAIVRLLVISDKSWVQDNFGTLRKNFTFLVCIAEPSIKKLGAVQKYLKKEKGNSEKKSYKELAYIVLAKAKETLHWTDIADRAYRLNLREKFDTRSLYNVLFDNEDLFVRVGQGTYGLVEWGTKQVEPYTEIIAIVLEEENQALPLDLIFVKVSYIRPIKQATLTMHLEMHHRFYKSINGTFGLRAWLPPREKQNLRTPEWLIEDSKSYERVERAKQRGYDVDRFIDDE